MSCDTEVGVTDWRTALLEALEPLPADPGGAANPAGWPDYEARPAVSLHRGEIAGAPVVVAAWSFAVYGGSFGEGDATLLSRAVDAAVAERRALVTLVRSGGTRLQEGMTALVGIPRARLALHRLAAARLPHLTVCDGPTTGGVWISVCSRADLRVAVAGGTVGFAGPRVVEAVTGEPVPPTSHTAESAAAYGLVDAVCSADDVETWLAAALTSVTKGAAAPPAGDGPAAPAEMPSRSGWAQVAAARGRTLDGAALLDALLDGPVALAAPRGDRSVAARTGRLAGRPVVAVALAAEVGGRPTPDGYRLLTRAAGLADRLGHLLLTFVDTPGAEPGPTAEADGVAATIAEATDAVLTCRSPVVAVLTGEGGSGGALAAAAGDRLLVGPDSYFGAIGPEGAAAALRIPPEEAADRLRLVPADLLALGLADALAPVPAGPSGDCGPLRVTLLAALDELAADPEPAASRALRWAAPLPNPLPNPLPPTGE